MKASTVTSSIKTAAGATTNGVTSSIETATDAVTKAAKVTSKAAAKATSTSMKTAAKAFGTSYHEYSWKELQSIEKRRRAILLQCEQSFWGILSHWDGTVLEILLHDSLLWITIFIYIGVRVWARFGIPSFVEDLGSGNITVIGSFISFFLVFYVNQSNSRYFALYGASCVRLWVLRLLCQVLLTKTSYPYSLIPSSLIASCL